MGENEFLGYVGDPDIHDGRILSVQQTGDQARVTIEAITGRRFSLVFRGVESLNAHQAEGMVLYALNETKAAGSLRRFVFSNWDDEDDAYLEMNANEVSLSQ